ncbi:hypothetical protein X777_08432 [Ooceraea biroi]|uniref:Uncharacterized protein n=1 Tax=Ooceraea biroi TaxID=2015173 RepID=A0A026WYU6_OOCBI|nr:hypothetical protein X777_08432 [Ooceraea biroi]
MISEDQKQANFSSNHDTTTDHVRSVYVCKIYSSFKFLSYIGAPVRGGLWECTALGTLIISLPSGIANFSLFNVDPSTSNSKGCFPGAELKLHMVLPACVTYKRKKSITYGIIASP